MSQSAMYFNTTAETYAEELNKNLKEAFGGDLHAIDDAVEREVEAIEANNPTLYERLVETIPMEDWDYDCLCCYFLDYVQTH